MTLFHMAVVLSEQERIAEHARYDLYIAAAMKLEEFSGSVESSCLSRMVNSFLRQVSMVWLSYLLLFVGGGGGGCVAHRRRFLLVDLLVSAATSGT